MMWTGLYRRLFGLRLRPQVDPEGVAQTRVRQEVVSGLDAKEAMREAHYRARLGRCGQAETLLRRCFDPASWPESALDLLAKIKAQQGKWQEALIVWQQLVCKCSQPEPYIKAVERVRRTLSRQSRGLTLGSSHLRLNCEQLGGDPRIVAVVRNGSLEIGLREKLFENGQAQLRPEAEPLVTAVGRRLEPFVGLIRITVIGHSHDQSRVSGQASPENGRLAMQRAITVFEHLMASTRLLPSSFSLQAAGEFDLPFSGAFPETEDWNETVTFQIVPAVSTNSGR
ncbi:MAG: OmpA family protein [Thermoguttaceae bacterium]|nr:OmpA family protein [Thermoguttaceae bacterium]MDW8079277.1 OmpA family protein [Thermoguttaceae bacterium]